MISAFFPPTLILFGETRKPPEAVQPLEVNVFISYNCLQNMLTNLSLLVT